MSSETAVAEIGLIPSLTFVIWVGCVVVGVIGWLASKALASAATAPAAISIETVELVSAPQQLTEEPAADEEAMADEIDMPSAAPVMAVAEPSPEIAFALPIAAPAVVTTAKRAVPIAAPAAAPPTNKVQKLTFGYGAGNQPAPDYPIEAQLAGQGGVVVVRFTVAADGRVLSAELAQGCRYSILNQSVLRKVRQSWRIPTGHEQTYEVTIEFVPKG